MTERIQPLEAELVLGFCEQIARASEHVRVQCSHDPEMLERAVRLRAELDELERLAMQRSQPGYPEHVNLAGARQPDTLGPRHVSECMEYLPVRWPGRRSA